MKGRQMVAAIGVFITACNAMSPFADAERAVKAELRDPESVKFSNEEHCGNSAIVSGRLNAKNIYGGYSGEQSFYYDGHSLFVFPLKEDGPFTDEFVALHKDDGSGMIDKCTAAIRASMSPEARNQLDNETKADVTTSDVNLNVAANEAADRAAAEAGRHDTEAPEMNAPEETVGNDAYRNGDAGE